MTDIQNFGLFLTLSWVLIITPGPDSIYVMTQGISTGKRAAYISATGVTLGILVHTLFAALGLSMILKTSAVAFSAVKLIGAGYLIYLGVKSILDKSELKLGKARETSGRKLFTRGLITNTLNPKVALFFMAFLPQFIRSESVASPMPFVTLGFVFALSTLIFLFVLSYFSGVAGNYLMTKRSTSKWINKIAGSIMILLGIRLAFMNQK